MEKLHDDVCDVSHFLIGLAGFLIGSVFGLAFAIFSVGAPIIRTYGYDRISLGHLIIYFVSVVSGGVLGLGIARIGSLPTGDEEE